ncbi:MAG TPA: HD domain-containing phosphohydrolase [Gemmatimonadaceae bacterium]|nr:HD domain-containing phosphohydrolase [Gemmatimonadaceae bacterium]
MADPFKFLTSFAQALSTMALYGDKHPARERAVDRSFAALRDLQASDPKPQFSFLGEETVYGQISLRDLRDWEWAIRLADAGVQRLEFEPDVTREEYEEFLEQVLARLTLTAIDSAEARTTRPGAIKFGAIGVRGETKSLSDIVDAKVPVATIAFSLEEEAAAVQWMHGEVGERGMLPLAEAEAVVRSLSLAMHGEQRMLMPLLDLRAYDEYTTTHSLNVSVLTMALAEYMGLSARDVRTFGVAGLLHDLGKVRVPQDILNKPGKLTDEERAVMQRHPVDGAKIILTSDRELDLAAAVAYEHHIMIDGGGYPHCHFRRACHPASVLVHVCDVYDALRTNRPYRAAWESARVLGYIEERAGSEFDPEVAKKFVGMMKELEDRVQRVVS